MTERIYLNVLRDGEPTILAISKSTYRRMLDVLKFAQQELEREQLLNGPRVAAAKFKRSKLWVNTSRTNIYTHPWLVPTGYSARWSAKLRPTSLSSTWTHSSTRR
jgi:hypothetical protein